MAATLNAACMWPSSAARRIAAKAWTALGAPASPMSSDRARSNQTCAFSSDGAGVAGLGASAALTDEFSAAMAIAAMQTRLAILIASSSPGDLDTPVLQLGDALICGHRQLRLAFGEHLESVRWNAPRDEAFQHRRRPALGDVKIDSRIAGAVRGARQDHDNGLAFVEGARGMIEHGFVLVSDRNAAHVEIDDERRGRGRRRGVGLRSRIGLCGVGRSVCGRRGVCRPTRCGAGKTRGDDEQMQYALIPG